ncbi:hypothetical protein UABAM_01990 [Candidatus Uabimicrobium amorphum]|uniref:Lysoplasmalogenase n=2 Tax=Uabimicrobium amorphum TaxID=2596890 RepID=A0A5S9ILC9_UABAM|nr:hypothetical protein UABAM_01990 [Candidatus Uabimicrobium amorphum]
MAIIVSALHLIAIACKWASVIYISKPLIVVFLLQVWNYQADSSSNQHIKQWFMMGLMFSLVGDVVLMNKQFVYGILFFLGAQCCYTVTFTKLYPWRTKDIIPAIPAATYMAFLLWVLLPKVGNLLIPITIYAFVISMMLWRALCITALKNMLAYLLACGSILFVVSDSCIAIDKFIHPIPYHRIVIMSTYIAAQVLLCFATIKLTQTDQLKTAKGE